MGKMNFWKCTGGVLLFLTVAFAPVCASEGVLLRSLARAGWRDAVSVGFNEAIASASSLAFQRELSRQFMPYLVMPNLSKFRPGPFNYYEPSVAQQKNLYVESMDIFKRGLEEIKSLNALVFYQQGSQARLISPMEIGDRLGRLQAVYAEVNGMDRLLSVPNNEVEKMKKALEQGKMYLSALGSGVMPSSFYVDKTPVMREPRLDRAFNVHEFFLETPSSYQEEHALWPETLKLAAIADGYFNTEVFYQMKVLPETRQWQIDIFKDPEEFLASPASTSYDVVITDLLVPNGGGVFLGTTLRNRGYNKALIALTAYSPIERLARSLWEKEFDGMISTDNTTPYSPQYLDLILHKLRNYFYYRNANGWEH